MRTPSTRNSRRQDEEDDRPIMDSRWGGAEDWEEQHRIELEIAKKKRLKRDPFKMKLSAKTNLIRAETNR